MTWSAVVPVKAIGQAKSRLLPAGNAGRGDLALAFLRDVLTALSHARALTEIIVVSTDEAVRGPARAAGARFLPEGRPAGLNPAALAGVRQAGPGQRVAVIAGDLPCLDAAAVDHILARAAEHERSFVCDAAGTGTTMLLTATPARCEPMFGERSRARHAAAGYVELGGRVELGRHGELGGRVALGRQSPDDRLPAIVADAFRRARRDVDTAVDLWDAIRIGVGAATQAALRSGLPRG
ncbi:MAG: 2-phospho-L-lactate guanylyltransferase [Actinomycetales bacterium]|nr:2-phospho-L-lactate guanylyltransferase [Actinomycetales bacterium]